MPEDSNYRRVSVVLPVILITIGVLFLLHNWRPSFEPWGILLDYWPLILIFVGLGKIYDNYKRSRNPGAGPGITVGTTVGILSFVVVLVLLFWHGRDVARRHDLYSSDFNDTSHTVDLLGVLSALATLAMSPVQLR